MDRMYRCRRFENTVQALRRGTVLKLPVDHRVAPVALELLRASHTRLLYGRFFLVLGVTAKTNERKHPRKKMLDNSILRSTPRRLLVDDPPCTRYVTFPLWRSTQFASDSNENRKRQATSRSFYHACASRVHRGPTRLQHNRANVFTRSRGTEKRVTSPSRESP